MDEQSSIYSIETSIGSKIIYFRFFDDIGRSACRQKVAGKRKYDTMKVLKCLSGYFIIIKNKMTKKSEKWFPDK